MKDTLKKIIKDLSKELCTLRLEGGYNASTCAQTGTLKPCEPCRARSWVRAHPAKPKPAGVTVIDYSERD